MYNRDTCCYVLLCIICLTNKINLKCSESGCFLRQKMYTQNEGIFCIIGRINWMLSLNVTDYESDIHGHLIINLLKINQFVLSVLHINSNNHCFYNEVSLSENSIVIQFSI